MGREVIGRYTLVLLFFLVPHFSRMGGNVLHYFMKWVAVNGGGESWVNNHIHAIANIGTPYLGVPKTISSILSGETRDTGLFNLYIVNKFLSSNGLCGFFFIKQIL